MVRVDREMLERAMMDALRLDYEGGLAKLCNKAIDDSKERLRRFVDTVIDSVVADEQFANQLADKIRSRVEERIMTKVDHHIKKMSGDQLQLFLSREHSTPTPSQNPAEEGPISVPLGPARRRRRRTKSEKSNA